MANAQKRPEAQRATNTSEATKANTPRKKLAMLGKLTKLQKGQLAMDQWEDGELVAFCLNSLMRVD